MDNWQNLNELCDTYIYIYISVCCAKHECLIGCSLRGRNPHRWSNRSVKSDGDDLFLGPVLQVPDNEQSIIHWTSKWNEQDFLYKTVAAYHHLTAFGRQHWLSQRRSVWYGKTEWVYNRTKIILQLAKSHSKRWTHQWKTGIHCRNQKGMENTLDRRAVIFKTTKNKHSPFVATPKTRRTHIHSKAGSFFCYLGSFIQL